MIAPLVEELTAKPAAPSATVPSSTYTSGTPSSDWTRMSTVLTQATSDPATSSLRRSTASATAPPHSPNTTSGMRLARPSMPTQNDDPVSS
jgi:hypothetical protein